MGTRTASGTMMSEVFMQDIRRMTIIRLILTKGQTGNDDQKLTSKARSTRIFLVLGVRVRTCSCEVGVSGMISLMGQCMSRIV